MSATHIRSRSLDALPHPSGRTYQTRLSNVQSTFPLHSIDALVVSRASALRYLTGFTGSNGLLIVRSRSARFFTDGRYREQSRLELGRRIPITVVPGGLFEAAVRDGALRNCTVVGFDDSEVSYRRFRDMRRLWRGKHLRPVSGVVEELACEKDRTEIAALAAAARISDTVFGEILTLIRPGIEERELALEITYRQSRLGAERDSFEPIVASGPRAAMPHARPGRRTLRRGDPVLLDFGSVVAGYGSDITRTVFLGRPHHKLRRAYDVVCSAQEAAFDLVRPGAKTRVVDAAARQHIARAGFGKNFPHSLGHGIGMEVHERPRIAPSSAEILRAGQVITIEPGIYLPGIGGVRIEDDLVVTTSGCQILTHSPRELIQL